jgi:hypothetical protein
MSEQSDVFLPFDEQPIPGEQTEYPYTRDLAQSAVIDFLLVMILIFICTNLMNKFPNAPDWMRICLIVFAILYEPFCTSRGFTLGHYIKKIRVRRAKNMQERISFFNALIRFVAKISLIWMPLIITTHNNTQGRRLHDILSGSVMIKIK